MASGTLALTGNYRLLDANRQAGDDLPRNNPVAAVFRLNATGIFASLERKFPEVAREEWDDDGIGRAGPGVGGEIHPGRL